MPTVHKERFLDPRTGLLLLLLANIVAFVQESVWLEAGWIVFLCVVMVICGCGGAAVKWMLAFIFLYGLQAWLLPVSPKMVATSFSIFANYSRRMFPCLMVGMLMIKRTPLRHLIVGLRKLHVPQKLIVSISVTLRYFPAIREEIEHIRDAMKLRNIRGLKKVECMVVPLMISATGTAEELSAAAVTRGIENPAPKTSVVELRFQPLDRFCQLTAVVFAAAAFMIK